MSQLWVEGSTSDSPGRVVQMRVKDAVSNVNWKVASRGARAVNAMRNAELQVLKGQRTGRKYRKPYTGGNKDRKPRKKAPTYTASAPGEAPARRTGSLRLHWNGEVKTGSAPNGGVAVIAELESQEEYSVYLEEGKGMAARPFVERIKERAAPEIAKIYNESYSD